MKQGITACEWCLTESPNNELDCPKCGGPIMVLEPWVLQCGWCGNSNRRDLTASCNNCGGPLPHIPGTPRQPEPPKAPRHLFSSYISKIRYWKNPSFLVGAGFMIFAIPGVCLWPMLLFPLIGFFILRYSLRQSRKKIEALQNGVPTRGIITEAYLDTSQHINHVHPIRIDYTFDLPDGTHESFVNTWDESNLKRVSGEHCWVVVNPKNPKQSNLWPPLR